MFASAPPCPSCGAPVPQRRTADGRRARGRPRVFCSDVCRRGGPRPAADPARLRRERAEFAAAVREAIAGSGLPLRELAERLAVGYGSLASSVTTLSAWQTGSSAPPGTSAGVDRVLALERCLGLPAGDLALLVPGGALPSSGRPDRPGHAPAGRRELVRHVASVLAGAGQVVPVLVAKERRLGTDRQVVRTAVRMRVRALTDGVDRLWYVHSPDQPRPPRPVSGPGCRLGREVRVPTEELVAIEVVLSRTLARGERHELAFELHQDDPSPVRAAAPVFRHLQPQPCERLELAVAFPPEVAPAEMLRVRWRPRDLSEEWRARTPPCGVREYRQVVEDPAPGAYGYRWRWAPVLGRRVSAA